MTQEIQFWVESRTTAPVVIIYQKKPGLWCVQRVRVNRAGDSELGGVETRQKKRDALALARDRMEQWNYSNWKEVSTAK